MTVINRHRRLPVILPRPPAGWPDMPCNVKDAISTAIAANQDALPAMLVNHEFNARNRDDQILLVWQIAGPQRWARFDCRTMFIDDEMTEALRRTSARVSDGSLRGEDVRFRYPAFLVWWPSNAWRDASNGIEITHTIVSCYDAGDHPVAHLLDGPPISMVFPLDARGLIFANHWNNGEVSSGAICMDGDLASHYRQYTENRITSTTGLTGDTEASFRVSENVTATIINLMLLMGSYPQYVRPISVKARAIGEKKAHHGTAYIVARTMAAKKTVVVRPSLGGGDQAYHVRPHEREAHWRRQPHGELWEIENPDISVVTLDDGRHAHMVWLNPMWIDAVAKEGS